MWLVHRNIYKMAQSAASGADLGVGLQKRQTSSLLCGDAERSNLYTAQVAFTV